MMMMMIVVVMMIVVMVMMMMMRFDIPPFHPVRYALRDVLVDLGAFHLMSSSTASSIANELMGYWLLLTEGR
jgi:hypothetical protein